MVPTFVVDAPPAGDEAVAQVEGDLMVHAHRKATRLDVVCEDDGGLEQQESHVVVGCVEVVVLVHDDVFDTPSLGVRPRPGQRCYSHQHGQEAAVPSEQKTKLIQVSADDVDKDAISKRTWFHNLSFGFRHSKLCA